MRPKVLSRVPSAALSSRRPPYLDRVLLSAVPRRRQYYEGATTSHYTHSRSLICFASGPHAVPPCFVLAVASAPERMEAPIRARIIVQPAIPLPARSRVDASGISQVSRRPLLCLCPVPRPRPDRRSLATSGRVRCCPCCRESKGSSALIISRPPRGFDTCCLRFKNGVATATCKTRFRLAG